MTNPKLARDAVIAGIARGDIPASLLDHEPNTNDPNVVGAVLAGMIFNEHPQTQWAAHVALGAFPGNTLLELLVKVTHSDANFRAEWRKAMASDGLRRHIAAEMAKAA
jgi:hypothetical protein